MCQTKVPSEEAGRDKSQRLERNQGNSPGVRAQPLGRQVMEGDKQRLLGPCRADPCHFSLEKCHELDLKCQGEMSFFDP